MLASCGFHEKIFSAATAFSYFFTISDKLFDFDPCQPHFLQYNQMDFFYEFLKWQNSTFTKTVKLGILVFVQWFGSFSDQKCKKKLQ